MTLITGGAGVALAIEDTDDGTIVVTDIYGVSTEVSAYEKVWICHVSPGNLRENLNEVGPTAVQGHLDHGDRLFACVIEADPTPAAVPTG
jgi:hypothetical protein